MRKILRLACTAFIAGILSGCNDSVDSASALTSLILCEKLSEYSTTTKTWSYSGNDISGKKIYLAKVNPTENVIKNQLYVRSAENVNLNVTSSSRNTADEFDMNEIITDTDITTYENSMKMRDSLIIPEELKVALHTAKISQSTDLSRGNSSIEEAYNVGDTRSINVITYYNSTTGDETFSAEESTLYAKTDNVYVWVVERYKNPYVKNSDGSIERKAVTTEAAENLAKKMEDIYQYICHVEVPKPDKIYDFESNTSFIAYDMNEYSTTGNKINVVITDCFASNSETSQTNGTIGVTFLIDLFMGKTDITQYSNCGNYFYLDSYYSVTDENESISTLAHEFQHLLAFNYKVLAKNSLALLYETGYNEMLSMLTEDMMSDYLGLTDENKPLQRLPIFNNYYYLTGVMEYNSYDNLYLSASYSNAYAFGAWLARNFGGTKIIHSMTNDEYSGMESVQNALKETTGNDYSVSSILKMYSEALIYDDVSAGYTSLNKDADTGFTYNGYEYPIQAIDLWDLGSILKKNSNANKKYDGPNYFTANQYSYLRPHGITLHYLGTVKTGAENITLNFQSTGTGETGITINPEDTKDTNVKYYVMFK
ncbi:MAG: hypothetical protein II367_06325 [Treponema sp.]|nr:hypothetical protein [Treponema sp.]